MLNWFGILKMLRLNHSCRKTERESQISMTILTRVVKSTTVLSNPVSHSVDSFLDFAWALVSLTLSSLALCTILNLETITNSVSDENEMDGWEMRTYLLLTPILWAISPQ